MLKMMPPLSVMPTSLPKTNSNFSIDWIVKNDKNLINNNNTVSGKQNGTPSPPPQLQHQQPQPLTSSDSLIKDYDRELSKALRLGDSNSDQLHKIPTNKDEQTPRLDNYLNRSLLTNDPMRTVPANPATMLEHQKISFERQALQSSLAAMQQNQLINAQLQMAAALSQQQQQQQHQQHRQPPQTMDFSQIFSSNFQRTPYSLQPWMMNRYGRFMPHGFIGDYMMHPYRKPKRIRTAFAPLQLLELENAFEGNQYVVGSERKALAKTLNLTETQVKVWFQNRRTKQKRMQQEGNPRGCSDDDESHVNNSIESDEQIDIEDDYDDSQ